MGLCPHQLLKKLDKTFKRELRSLRKHILIIWQKAKTIVFAIKFFAPLSFKKVDEV
jgi:hypothetical protein